MALAVAGNGAHSTERTLTRGDGDTLTARHDGLTAAAIRLEREQRRDGLSAQRSNEKHRFPVTRALKERGGANGGTPARPIRRGNVYDLIVLVIALAAIVPVARLMELPSHIEQITVTNPSVYDVAIRASGNNRGASTL